MLTMSFTFTTYCQKILVTHTISLSLTFLLYVQADIAFEDDKGFHETIRTLGQQAKKPIILTCHTTGFLKDLDVEYTHVHVTQHLDVSLSNPNLAVIFLLYVINDVKASTHPYPAS